MESPEFGCGATIFISVGFLAQGNFLIGAILFGAFGLIDLLDGTMARMLGTAGPWGAFLDFDFGSNIGRSSYLRIDLLLCQRR